MYDMWRKSTRSLSIVMDEAVTEGGVKYKSTGSSWLAPVNAIPNPQQPHAPCRRWDPAQRTALMAFLLTQIASLKVLAKLNLYTAS